MALYRKAAAILNVEKPSICYDNDAHNPSSNPVFQAFEQQLNFCMTRKKATGKKTTKTTSDHSDDLDCKLSNNLFELWNSFENRLPRSFFFSRVLDVGDTLSSMQEYGVAARLCYNYYLMKHSECAACAEAEDITCATTLKRIFFPAGLLSSDATMALRAMLGKSICSFYVIKQHDPCLSNERSVQKSLKLLAFLQRIMEAILPEDSLCWVVYNATVYSYYIGRQLMKYGYSAKVIDYLLWASVCMETSVPLIGVKYLPWRSTLYTAVCQCYSDMKRTNMSEAFARRAITKINELSELMKISTVPANKDWQLAFTEATVKMAVMVFKRSVFETRKRPKGVLRPKQTTNMKEVSLQPWPRTATEKLLVGVCHGSAAQALCILEALSDSNRRILISSSPVVSDLSADSDLIDVYVELFMAAHEIIGGGGGSPGKTRKKDSKDSGKLAGMDGVLHGRTMMDLAANGEDGVTLGVVVKMVKWSYNYRQWDFFDAWLPRLLLAVKEANDCQLEAELKIIQAFDKVATPHGKQRKQQADDKSQNKLGDIDDIVNLAETLLSVAHGPIKMEDFDINLVVDASVWLWNKCKSVFGRQQTGIINSPRFLEKIDNCGKWISVLETVYQTVHWCGLGAVDPILSADVSLRLGLILEAASQLRCNVAVVESTSNVSNQSLFNHQSLDTSPSDLLMKARDVFEVGLKNASLAMSFRSPKDGRAVTDVVWIKECMPSLFSCQSDPLPHSVSANENVDQNDVTVGAQCSSLPAAVICDKDAVWEQTKDMHVELMFHGHRINLKLALPPTSVGQCETSKPKPRWNNPTAILKWLQSVIEGLMVSTNLLCLHARNTRQHLFSHLCATALSRYERRLFRAFLQASTNNAEETCAKLVKDCRRNRLSLALLCLQRALLAQNSGGKNDAARKMIEEATGHLCKFDAEERKLFKDNVFDVISRSASDDRMTSAPTAPILVSRTDTTMTFRPVKFNPCGREQVAWYRLFGRVIVSSDVKARLSDYALTGTGEEVAANEECEFIVTGLTPGEKYVFAVGAYTASGQLIGNSVGEATKPILASHPMSLLMAWNYLCQVSCQVCHHQQVNSVFASLWAHFVSRPPSPSSDWITQIPQPADFHLTLHRLNSKVIERSSQVVLRSLMWSFFSAVDVMIRDEQLYCDVLCENQAIYFEKQLRRIKVCEVLMPAMELAAHLNDTNSALQAVAHCYGLLAPTLHFKISSTPVLQILERCIAVLQEIPGPQKRGLSTIESLFHMVACISYHLAKVLRCWGESDLADHFNAVGRKLLNPAYDPRNDRDTADSATTMVEEVQDSLSYMELGIEDVETKSKDADVVPKTKNAELNALELTIQKINKQQAPSLSGTEDISILHGIIAYLPSSMAFVEVKKFKRRPRYLEFFVQLAEKAIAEGNGELVIDWCTDAEQILTKRNEKMYGAVKSIVGRQAVVTIIGDDPKTFQAAMVEYSREQNASKQGKHNKQQGSQEAASQQPTSRKEKKTEDPTAGITDPVKLAQIQKESKARSILQFLFLDMYRNRKLSRKLRSQITDERPWRSQLNAIQGFSHFGSLIAKLEFFNLPLSSFIYRPALLDPTLFTLEAAETLIAGHSGLLHNHRPVATIPSTVDVKVPEPVHKSGQKQQTPKQIVQPETECSPFVSAIETAAGLIIVGDVPPTTARVPKLDEAKVKNAKNGKTETVAVVSVTKSDVTNCLLNSFAYLSRAVVLAHRGRHWILLQNACRDLWNCVQLAMLASHAPDKDGGDVLTMNDLRELLHRPLYVAADCLLDMLLQTGDQLNRMNNVKTAGSGGTQWIGNIADEQGGAGTKFDVPHDDMTTIDLRCLKRIVLLSLEMLHYQQRWEKLVDIGLRFSALTGYRYAETVDSLVVHAQHQLIARLVSNRGILPPQPHYLAAIHANNGRPIASSDYLHLQLCVQFDRQEMIPKLEPGAQIDPRGHMIYTNQRALQLCSVPLDIAHSLQTLREVLQMSNYTARALENSRRMLVLYLAGQTSLGSSCDVEPAAENSGGSWLSVMPRDLSSTLFETKDEIGCKPLAQTDLACVIQSYEKTIDLLAAKGRKSLKAEAMRELGNIHYHAKNSKLASKWWQASLDCLTNIADTLGQWRCVFKGSEDIPRDLLQKCGLWGCLIGGIITSNIAQYTLTGDLGQRLECCFLSGFFFKALFRSSLPHPIVDRAYALYEIGDGCEVTSLVPGVDLLSERYRSDARTVVAAVRFVVDELCKANHYLFSLPLLTLYQYWSSSVCRNVQWTIDCRLIRLRALSDLGLFTEAIEALLQLMTGELLPQLLNGRYRTAETRSLLVNFNAQLPLVDETNMAVVDYLTQCRLSASLGAVYGPQLTCRLAVDHAHLLIKIAETVLAVPKYSNQPGRQRPKKKDEKGQQPAGKKASPDRASSRANDVKPAPPATKGANKTADGSGEPVQSRVQDIALEDVKGSLLSCAEGLLSTISDAVIDWAISHDGVSALNASELDLAVSTRLELAAVAVQRQHTLLAAKYLFDVMKLLQTSSIWRPVNAMPVNTCTVDEPSFATASAEKPEVCPTVFKIIESESSRYELNNTLSRWRLDGRLWIQCRLALVKCLLVEPKGFKYPSEGVDERFVNELNRTEWHCEQGLREAEACCDVHLQAEFLYCGAVMHILSGNPVEKSLNVLKEIEIMLEELNHLSDTGVVLLVNTKLLKGDIEVMSDRNDDRLINSLASQDVLLKSLESLGEVVKIRCEPNQSHHSTVASPLNNIYLPQLQLLVHVKLRVGQALAVGSAHETEHGNSEATIRSWNQSLGVLMTALELNNCSASKNIHVHGDIFLSIGQVQRQLCHSGACDATTVAKTLVQVIETCIAAEGDLGLIRKAYMELAVLYLGHSGLVRLDSQNYLEPELESGKKQLNKERTAAWYAVCCAAMCSKAQSQRSTLLPASDDVEKEIGSQVAGSLPDFVALGCVGPATVEGSDLLVNLLSSSSYGAQLEQTRKLLTSVSWKRLLEYQNIMHRMCSASVLNVLSCSYDGEPASPSYDGEPASPLYDCSSGSMSLFVSSANELPLSGAVLLHPRWLPFATSINLRLNYLHSYLSRTYQQYAKLCCAVSPPAGLDLEPTADDELFPPPVFESYADNRPLGPDGKPLEVKLTSTDAVSTRQEDAVFTHAAEGLIVVQWYQPALERTVYEHTETGRKVVMLYSFVNKGKKKQCGARWVSVSQLRALHRGIVYVLQTSQLTKLSKDDKNGKKSKKQIKSSSSSTSSAAASSTSQSAADIATSDSQREIVMASLRQFLAEARNLLGTSTGQLASKANSIMSVASGASKESHSTASNAQSKSKISIAGSKGESSKISVNSTTSRIKSGISFGAPRNDDSSTDLNVMEEKLDHLEELFNSSSGLVTVDASLRDWFKTLLQ